MIDAGRLMLPEADYLKMVDLAEKNDTTIAALAAECVRQIVNGIAKKRRADAGKRRRVWTARHDAELVRLYEDGWADLYIAERMKWDQKTIGNHRRALGLPPLFHGRGDHTPRGTTSIHVLTEGDPK